MADVATAATPDVPNGQEHKYHFNIVMSCGGCSGAVDRVLKKLEGVKSYTVSLETQTATVIAEDSLPYEKVLKTIAKTGKKVTKGEADGEERSVEVPKDE
ncbi:Cytosolic copper metallochaperone [Podospora pseudocomata]|uniref:Cytosolic copper metallochaperone n=1 Tax=Podospora pseudocomata TaxID=2093779 RepID=A0ABR0GJB4_9PEZI|nr:Cytosolic copper metallochaperone [Podospora pseudocomata]